MKKDPHRPRPAGTTRNLPEGGDRAHLERLLDGALADSFPASDPLSTLVPERTLEAPLERVRPPRRARLPS